MNQERKALFQSNENSHEVHRETLAVISTAHLPEHEAEEDFILNMVTQQAHAILWRREGFMVNTGLHVLECPVMNYVLGFMRAKGFDWVMFDRDADTYDQLKTYDW